MHIMHRDTMQSPIERTQLLQPSGYSHLNAAAVRVTHNNHACPAVLQTAAPNSIEPTCNVDPAAYTGTCQQQSGFLQLCHTHQPGVAASIRALRTASQVGGWCGVLKPCHQVISAGPWRQQMVTQLGHLVCSWVVTALTRLCRSMQAA